MGVVYYYLLNRVGFLQVECLQPLYYLAKITQILGFLHFDNPPLPFTISYWNEEYNIYTGQEISQLLNIKDDRIINASMIPIPKDRKTASEIVCLFQEMLIKSEIYKNNNSKRFSDIYSFP